MSAPATPDEQRRQYYRIDYLKADRPEFRCARFSCPVANVSERGMSLVLSKTLRDELEIGTEISGVIGFRFARPVTVKGEVVRHHSPGMVAVKLTAGAVPWPTVLTEQRALLKRYETARL